MAIQPISVTSFSKAFAVGLWQIKLVLLGLLGILAIDIGIVVLVSTCRGRAAREAIGWFFGNGSGIQDLAWPQMFCCIISAVLGYIFLGVLLATAVQAFAKADRK